MADWRATTDAQGRPIWRDSETGQESPREGEIRTQAAGPGTGADLALSAPDVPQPSANTRSPWDPFGIGEALRGRFQGSIMNPTRGAEPAPVQAAPSLPGATIGAVAGASPGLFPEGYQYEPPEYQEEVLGIIREALGTGSTTGSEADRTTPPTFTEDPAVRMRVDQASARRDRMMPILEEEIARIRAERERHAGRSNMQQFGEWLSRWAASGDPGRGGQTLIDMRERTANLQRQWTMEILRLTEAGYSLEDAVASANANVASAQHQAGERTSIAGYEDAVGDRAARLSERGANASLAGTLASVLAGFGAQNEAAEREALGVLSGIPGYEGVGASLLGQSMFPGNPEVADVFSSSASEEADMAEVLSQLGMERGDRRRLERLIRRLRPNWNQAQINRAIQRQTMMGAGAE